ncbi:MAG: zeta toxin family protein [Bacteroidales bacterium]|nr:zeta toxin family protein [Bacteroidales bacterium]MBR4690204.1 zeta toxin family protein [Bacteroidales bacterium]
MPELTIIAGCNGAGKSTFAKSFLPANETSFDYDRTFIEFYNSLPDSELRDSFAQQKVNELFQSEIEFALSHSLNFCYETNFDEYPLYWAEQFKAKGYSVKLIFFCLESIEIAQKRILMRKEFKGHFIDSKTVSEKWMKGYKNLDLNFSYFDKVIVVDNSIDKEPFSVIVTIEKQKKTIFTSLPSYFNERLPILSKSILI